MNWWKNYEKELPDFEDDKYKNIIKDMTGYIPLLLHPLRQYTGKKYEDFAVEFWNATEIISIASQLYIHANTIAEKLSNNSMNWNR